ncbi:ribose-phosphate diphosphokinase [Archaeoglobales archaeon]|mgnify:CR=1 FL=1|nr:MAG: ribose-phosphate diphosphokinase [Archaeoglobales archaeon]
MKVVAGNASPMLGLRVAKALNLKLAKTTFKKFPDGEIYVRVEDFDERNVVIQSLNCNEDVVSLILLFDALNETEIVAAIPYMGYARQDKAFEEGEAVSIRAIARLLESYASKIITVNVHSKDAASHFNKLIDLDAMPIIGNYFKEQDVVMLSPDFGSYERVKVAAKAANCEFDYLEKKRIDAETVEITPKSLDVEGREVVVVDDIISTGGTMIEAAKMLLKGGAKSVKAACVHAVLANYALSKLYNAGVTEVIATDTIEKAVSKISVAGLVANEVSRLI